jgi:hypothetical protein
VERGYGRDVWTEKSRVEEEVLRRGDKEKERRNRGGERCEN